MFVNAEKVPVTVYRHDDTDAIQLPHAVSGSVRTLLKACLHTGYGDKAGAGWSMPFEDLEAGVTVLRPPVSAEQDYYLRISEDDGRKITIQIYFDMTDINTGDLKLQCDTEFKYGTATLSGEWLLIACERGFWFFCGTSEAANGLWSHSIGSYLYCGDTTANTSGNRALYLKHTGGAWGDHDDDRYWIFSTDKNGATQGKLLTDKGVLHDINPKSMFNGKNEITDNVIVSQAYLIADKEIWHLPAFFPSNRTLKNYEVINIAERQMINHGHGLAQYTTNLFIPTDYWEL